MKDKTKISLMVLGIALLIIGAVSVSYAFLSVTKKQDLANIFTSGCLNISIENESDAITLSNTYPITDTEGLESTGYTFTIKNTCNTSTNYMINLESLNQTTNTLDTEYIKTSLSSDTMDNLIQKLDSNLVTEAYIENAYVSHNLYKGVIEGNSTKEFNLKIWIDYDTTKEQGASKTYTSKINVIANPDIEVPNTPEIKTTLVGNTLEGNITGNSSTAKYCTTSDNICTPNTSTTITNNSVNINVTGEKRTETVLTALGNIEVNTGGKAIVCTTINNGKIYCSNPIETEAIPNFKSAATADEGVYSVSDGMYGGYSYYWRGAVTNNYVKFANFCWRIVRINGDGSIRLIYDGTSCHANGTSTTDSLIQPTSGTTTYTYNASYNQSNYVGWTYTGTSQRTLSGTASNAKTQTEKWFDANITGTNLTKVDTSAKYCNDRDAQSGSTWTINGSTFYYAAYKRTYTDRKPTLSCPSGDTYPLKVGAITADEVEFAGGWNANNTSYYLYNGQNYWTMSPSYWYSSGPAVVFAVNLNGYLDAYYVSSGIGLRPVINLKADTLFATGGTGTQSNPYVVS